MSGVTEGKAKDVGPPLAGMERGRLEAGWIKLGRGWEAAGAGFKA